MELNFSGPCDEKGNTLIMLMSAVYNSEYTFSYEINYRKHRFTGSSKFNQFKRKSVITSMFIAELRISINVLTLSYRKE